MNTFFFMRLDIFEELGAILSDATIFRLALFSKLSHPFVHLSIYHHHCRTFLLYYTYIEMYCTLQKEGIRIPAEMEDNLRLLHSYHIIKVRSFAFATCFLSFLMMMLESGPDQGCRRFGF